MHSVIHDSTRIIEPGCYGGRNGTLVPGRELDVDTLYRTFTFRSDVVCYTMGVNYAFTVFLVLLQVITLIWLYMILRVAWKVVTGGGADDTRSEDEDEGDDDYEDEIADMGSKTTLP